MKITKTSIRDLFIIEPSVYEDERGWFQESYSLTEFSKLNLNFNFIQDNHSYSKMKGTLRGLHLQLHPYAQTKLVRCTNGSLLDVAVDLRKNSPTFLKSFSIELSAQNKKQLLIPKGFAHGFITLEDDVEIQYKVDQIYSPMHDLSINYSDPLLNIDWGTRNPILSDKDANAKFLNDIELNLVVRDGEK